ncbi:MAG: RICIN domain-containing protein [Oscillospiraceae bacterium]|nr:RICIN domain-containing protein [Oscillospiraceae bacterium]
MKYKFMKKAISSMLSTMLAVSVFSSTIPKLAVNAAYSRVGVHDPSVVKLDDGSYYIIGSHLAAARSTDLCNWTTTANSQAGTANTTYFENIYKDLAIPNAWSNTSTGYDLSGNLWAPDIVWNPVMNKFCMYLSVNGNDWHSSIVLCTADNIDGPYTYVDTIVYSGFETNPLDNANNYKNTDVEKVLGNNPDLSRYLNSDGRWDASYGTNAIDPCVFYDENDNLWMVYGSWFGGIYMLELDETTGLRDYNINYETVANRSDAYLGKKMAGGYYASGEGPYIEYMKSPDSNKGYYYLFLSYGYFNSNGGYNMRVFRSENPDGPYVDQNGNSAIYTTWSGDVNTGGTVGERLMSNYQWNCNDRPNKAQGHNSALMDDDGKLYVIYHNKFDDAYGFHEVRVHQMFINQDGWLVTAPYEYSGETISETGHTTEAITGEYEFIFHTLEQKFVNETSADVETSKNISLNADGTITGDINGTWSVQDGTSYVTILYNNIEYKGNFLVQADESAEAVQKMTFTATGNNTCIWGSKISAYDASVDNVDLTNYNSNLVYNTDSVTGTGSYITLCDTDLLSGVSYFITNKNSQKVLALDNNNIQQWTKTGGSQQEWRIISVDNNYCKIVSLSDESKCLAVAENSAENGLNIELQTYTGKDNQLWKLMQDGTAYGIVSKCSDNTAGLDVYDWSTENGGNINQWEYWGGDCQLWYIEPVYPVVPSGNYTIRNLNSGLFLADNNSNVVQSNAQTWTFTRLDDDTYTIQTTDGKALTVENNSADDGANIMLSDNTGADSQKFIMHCNKDGSYSLMSVSSNGNACIDVYEMSLENNANICQWNFWGGDGQKFIIEPVAENLLKGDINQDGSVTVADAVILQKYLLCKITFTKTQWEIADMNQDGLVNIFDLVLLKSKLIHEK